MSSLELLLQNVCLLLASRTRDIVKALLGFLKVLLFSLDVKILASHVNVIVSEEESVFSSSYLKVSNKLTMLLILYSFVSVILQMEGINNMNDMRRHFRGKLKSIYTKLIRKFGYALRLTTKHNHSVLSFIIWFFFYSVKFV